MSIDKLKELAEILKNKETNDSILSYFTKINNQKIILNNQLERFHNKYIFENFIKKVILKYDSEEYYNRWIKRGIEPPEHLYWFLFEYVQIYGRECNEDEWKKYGNSFTAGLFEYQGYYFNLMIGQGSAIKVMKEF
jgi:hypothetical protein